MRIQTATQKNGYPLFGDGRVGPDCGREVNRVGLCLFASNSVINHTETRMIDPTKSPLLFTLLA